MSADTRAAFARRYRVNFGGVFIAPARERLTAQRVARYKLTCARLAHDTRRNVMQITGDNLLLVRMALAGVISDIQTHIGSCPDVNEYAADLLEYEQEKTRFERFARKVDAAIQREQQKRGVQ